MDIVYSSSDKYAELAAVSMASVMENCKDAGSIHFYIIDMGITEEHKKALSGMVSSYGREIDFLPDIDIEGIVGTRLEVFKWHLSTFSRLFLLHVIPENIDKILYLDCDMIIRHSLKNLWETDFDGCWVMAVDDCRGKMYRTDIGIPEDSIYTNNGLMYIDLAAWRKNHVETLFINYIRKHKGNITYVDQGVLNGVLQPKHKIKLLPITYNMISACIYLGYDGLDACRKPVWAYTKEEFERDIADPTVVHFTSCFYAGTRPWEKEDDHPYRKEFLKYRELTSWKEEPLWDNEEPRIKKLEYKVCRMIPDKILFGIIGFLHTKVFPVYRIICKKVLHP